MRSPSGTERNGSESHQLDLPQAMMPSSKNWSVGERNRNGMMGAGLKAKDNVSGGEL